MPPANLTVQNLGGATVNALEAVNSPPPTDVSTVTSSTVTNAPDQSMPTLSLLNHMGSAIIKPTSQKNAVLKVLANFKQAQTSGSCGQPVITDHSSPGIVDVTVTWDNVQCTNPSSGDTMTINGSVTVKGTYNETAGSLNITESYNNLTFVDTNTTSNYSIKFSINGSETISGAGLIVGTTSITYSDKGNGTISGSFTSTQGNGTISGWVSVDDTFTGTPSQLVYAITHGKEISINSTKMGMYGAGTITMTIGSSPATLTINGGAAYGVTGTSTGYNFEGKYTTAYSNVVFDPNICYGSWPSGGTLTITANHVFVLDFSINSGGTQCGCANVTEDGTPVSNNPVCNLY